MRYLKFKITIIDTSTYLSEVSGEERELLIIGDRYRLSDSKSPREAADKTISYFLTDRVDGLIYELEIDAAYEILASYAAIMNSNTANSSSNDSLIRLIEEDILHIAQIKG